MEVLRTVWSQTFLFADINEVTNGAGLLDLSSDDEESFNELLQQGLRNRIASGKTPAKTPGKPIILYLHNFSVWWVVIFAVDPDLL